MRPRRVTTPDGYTVFSADNGVLIYNTALYKKLPYDAETDFALLGMMGRSPLLITASPTDSVADVASLMARVKAEPGKLAIATPGIGSPHHLALELFQREAGLSFLHVPYKGGAPAMQDLMASQVPLADPNVNQKLYDAGWEVRAADAGGWTRYVEAERKKWQALIKARNITLD